MTKHDPESQPLQRALALGFEVVISNLERTADVLGLPISRTVSMSWPDERVDASIAPVERGDLYPELLGVGRKSYLMGAIAIGINSVRHTHEAEEIFWDLSNTNREPLVTTDSRKHVDERIKAVRNFKLPILKEVSFRPLVNMTAENLRERMPLPRTFEAIDSGGAIIFPLPSGVVAGTERGRQSWSVITGYLDKVIHPDADKNASADIPSSKQELRSELVAATPLRNTGQLMSVSVELMTNLLGDAQKAYVISPVVDKAASHKA